MEKLQNLYWPSEEIYVVQHPGISALGELHLYILLSYKLICMIVSWKPDFHDK